MKNLIITIIILGAIIFVPKYSDAQRHYRTDNTSELKLRMYDNAIYEVIFDRKIYEISNSLFRISNVRPGNHRIIVKEIYGRYGNQRIIFRGNINISPRSIITARINRYNNLIITRVSPVYDDEYDDYDDSYYRKPLLDLARLKNSLRRANFESDKKRIARQAISTHRVRANQVYQILMMFSFESTKLKIAKFSYRYCIDKRNYYRVNDAFTFSSSIRELDNYIGSYRSDYYDDDWEYYRPRY